MVTARRDHRRSGEPNRAITEVRGLDDYEPRDWSPKGTQPARAGKVHVGWSQVIADPHTPCSLCEPGYVCAFHREP